MEPTAEHSDGPFRCLIADDSEFARKNIAKIVSLHGGSVVGEAATGKQAVDLYNSLLPDLVLLDITMPELNGIESLRKIMEIDREAKVIVVSSLGHKDMVREALRLGASHFITKPYEPSFAGMIISAVLHKRKERGDEV